MANDNVCVTWFWKSWTGKTGTLTFAEKGLWIDLIEKTYTGARAGYYDGFMLAVSGGTVEEKWRLMCSLALKKVGAEISVKVGEELVPIELETLEKWQDLKPTEMTVIQVYCAKSEKVWEDKIKIKLSQDAYNHKKRNKGNEGVKAHSQAHSQADSQAHSQADSQAHSQADSQADSQTSVKDGLLLARVSHSPILSITPPNPPPSGEGNCRRRGGKRSKSERVEFNSQLMVRIGGWFGRGEKTLWAKDEAEALARVNPADEELELLERYYRWQNPEISKYLRRNIKTLLNNWTGDCDVARRKLAEVMDDDAALRRVERGARMAAVGVE